MFNNFLSTILLKIRKKFKSITNKIKPELFPFLLCSKTMPRTMPFRKIEILTHKCEKWMWNQLFLEQIYSRSFRKEPEKCYLIIPSCKLISLLDRLKTENWGYEKDTELFSLTCYFNRILFFRWKTRQVSLFFFLSCSYFQPRFSDSSNTWSHTQLKRGIL